MATTISMTGADSAHLRRASAETSRVVLFPDGVSRLIRLTAWQWEVFDRWPEITGWPLSKLTGQVLSMALSARDDVGSETFEADVRYGLAVVLDEMKSCCTAVPLHAVNENL